MPPSWLTNKAKRTCFFLIYPILVGALVLAGCTPERELGPSAPEEPAPISPADHGPAQHDLLVTGDAEIINGALFLAADPSGNEGTGNLDPFLTVTAHPSETPIDEEDGANTMGDTSPWDPDIVTGGDRTKAIRLDEVPTIPCPSEFTGHVGELCREITLDGHESNNEADNRISIDEIQVFLADDPNLDGDDLNFGANPPTLTGATLIYDLATTGEWINLTTLLQSGSGAGDMRMLILDSQFGGEPGCNYDAGAGTDCDDWVIMYTLMGAQVAAEATFEEWGVRLLPFVDVEKTVETTVTREAMWEITKTVDPATWDLFQGDMGTSEYTIDVNLLEGEEEDIAWSIEGEITISNTSGEPARILSVTDEIEGIGTTPVTCPFDPDSTLNNNESIVCTYGPVSLPDGTERDNEATVVVAEDAEGDPLVDGVTTNDIETFDFTDPDNVILEDGEVHVDDTNDDGDLSGIEADTTYMYSRMFTCDDDEGTHDNTADLFNEEDTLLDSDDATVTVNCYDLTVVKDADTELTRTWTWEIEKTGEESTLTLAAGQQFLDFTYTVTVDTTGHSDSDWEVSGQITITNPNPAYDADLDEVLDSIAPGDIQATVVCPSLVVPKNDGMADGQLVCTYGPVSLPDGDARTNKAIAKLQNKSFDKDKVATDKVGVTTSYDGSAMFDFGPADVVNEVDECIDVTDDFGTPMDPMDDIDLGTVCITDMLPADLTYDRDFGPFTTEQCGDIVIVNTSSFLTNDTDATGSDPFTLTITVTCPVSCSLTPGYWKTHNVTFHGGAPPDDTWLLLPDVDGDMMQEAEGEDFFLSDQTWFEVLWTPKAGNVYYNLSFHYIAAILNDLNEADGSLVASELMDAETFFNACTPAVADDLKGNDTCAGFTRKDLIEIAGTLAAFNEGTLPGTEHCDEDETSEE